MIIEINGKSFELGENIRKSVIGTLDILSGYASYKLVTTTFDILGMISGTDFHKKTLKLGGRIIASAFAIMTSSEVNRVSNGLLKGFVNGANQQLERNETKETVHFSEEGGETRG